MSVTGNIGVLNCVGYVIKIFFWFFVYGMKVVTYRHIYENENLFFDFLYGMKVVIYISIQKERSLVILGSKLGFFSKNGIHSMPG